MDPYKILGVSPTATDEEVKAAYRNLVKKYHPDRYTDSALKEQAAEKIKEINGAYAEIERIRSSKSGASSGYRSASYGGYRSYYSDPKYQVVRARINQGDLNGAEVLLDGMREQDAEWHYLKGIILLRKGWQDGARQHFAMAYNMQPDNREYAHAYQSINQMGGFRNFYGSTGDDCGMCDICAGMMLLDLCCGRRC